MNVHLHFHELLVSHDYVFVFDSTVASLLKL